ncbi:hypothetical protein DPMN_005845 [Dreissena polymorpha]|uniref:Uncharacterized protein n=1 Tax=Dreissena polymorpha TaxID=45954 RepID=A0A9D4MT12_DREPO|nr:hypothetical protein DPMN_005845 [Dreissena polymorpha]
MAEWSKSQTFYSKNPGVTSSSPANGRGGVGDGCCGYSGDAIVVVVKLRCVGGVVESADVMGLVVVATGVGVVVSGCFSDGGGDG